MAKRLGLVAALLVVALVAVYFALGQRATVALAERPSVRPVVLPAPDTSALARGAHLARVLGCEECHGATLGGKAMGEAPPMAVHAPNLTRGPAGLGDRLTPERVEAAVRQGIGVDGRWLYVMPVFPGLADADVAALAAYVAQVPAADGLARGVSFTALGRLLVGAGQMVPEAVRTPPAAPPPVPPTGGVAMGEYYVGLTCQHCHGQDLRGAPHPDPAAPAGPDLGPASRWDAAAFARTLRTGKRPTGPDLDARWMPWTAFAHFTDEEVASVQAALQQRLGAR